MTSTENQNRARDPAEHLRKFIDKPESKYIATKYASLVQTPAGIAINAKLTGLAMLRLARRMTRQEYRQSLRQLAAKSGLPLADFRLLARCSRELTRCTLSGSEQIAFTPMLWDAEEEAVWDAAGEGA
jgi:hypothetical protein